LDGLFAGKIPAAVLQSRSSGSYAIRVNTGANVSDLGFIDLAVSDCNDPDVPADPTPGLLEFSRSYHTTVVYDSLATTDLPTLAPQAPIGARILASVPNPFGGVTEIRYEIASAARVRLDIYGVTGRLIRRVLDDRTDPGVHSSFWDARGETGKDVANGVYLAVLRAGGSVSSYKLQVVR
jgi:hypothetical protein